MTKRMLIEATHPEETRVVVVDGKRLEEFDYESANKRQIKGNIYLAKVTRVEPSLQAAFVDYGGNRHGFLAFSEIHPDYYRIPVADREALLAEHAAMAAAEAVSDAEEDLAANVRADLAASAPEREGVAEAGGPRGETPSVEVEAGALPLSAPAETLRGPVVEGADEAAADDGDRFAPPAAPATGAGTDAATESAGAPPADMASPVPEAGEMPSQPISVETVGGDEAEEMRRRRSRPQRRYKIQEVIKRRQIMLVQVTKEERGNKGAALTTYLSLAGRYCVLMPNTGRGGGISRKITSATDRKRLKSILEEFEIADGMAVIVRTAGSERNKTELRRDYEYLLRLWDEIRELTLKSTAPTLIYEEASLIKRAIRDLYARDIEEVLVEGEEAYKGAKNFMRTLMPSHAKRVQLYKDPTSHLLHRFQVEGQLDAIHNPVVQLRSGGYIVINSTEALVAIDVNSGRATRERNIEETALKTNIEAADEIARQLRLRDLAGLIVIDFIDMEENRNNAAVERRLKEAMRHDRARIQVGRISPFGLLELSRQRLRPSLIEASTEVCRYCRGSGHVRSTESTALHVLRALEEEGTRSRSAALTVAVPTAVALYVLNNKRTALAELEQLHALRISITADDSLVPPDYRMERVKVPLPLPEARPPVSHPEIVVEGEEVSEEEEAPVAAEAPPEEVGGRRRSRRRRRRRDEGRPPVGEPAARLQPRTGPPQVGPEGVEEEPEEAAEEEGLEEAAAPAPEGQPESEAFAQDGDGQRRRRRRGRRGGRRRRRGGERPESPAGDDMERPDLGSPEVPASDQPSLLIEAEPAGGDDATAVREEPSAAAESGWSGETSANAGARHHHGRRSDHRQPADVAPDQEAWSRTAHDAAAALPQDGETAPSRPSEPTPAPDSYDAGTIAVGAPPAGDERAAGPPRRGWWKRLIE